MTVSIQEAQPRKMLAEMADPDELASAVAPHHLQAHQLRRVPEEDPAVPLVVLTPGWGLRTAPLPDNLQADDRHRQHRSEVGRRTSSSIGIYYATNKSGARRSARALAGRAGSRGHPGGGIMGGYSVAPRLGSRCRRIHDLSPMVASPRSEQR